MTASSSPLRSFSIFALVCAAGLTVAAALCVYTWAGPLLLLAACLIGLCAFSRLNLTNLAVSYILSDHIFQFVKRCIFLFGTPSRTSYYSFQALPAVLLGLGLLASLFVLKDYRLPASAKVLLAFLLVSVGNTLLSPGASLFARLGGTAQHTFPITAIFLGMVIPLGAWKRIGALLLGLIVLSSVYGTYQFVHGPTALDRAWAQQAAGYSIEAGKVFYYTWLGTGEFRAYSYLGDHLTWGFFLVVAFVGVIFARSLRLAPQRWVYIALPFTMVGIFVAQTRTVWVAFLATMLIYRVMTLRGFRRPLLVITGLFVGFAVVIYGGRWADEHVISRITSNALINRYLTIGTIEARTSAAELFIRVLPTHLFVGEGLGTSGDYSALSNGQGNADYEAQFSHNIFVDFLLYMGLPGVLLIVAFFYAWLREAFWLISVSDPLRASGLRWLVALFVGMWFTGALNGSTFMGGLFFLVVGVVTGEVMRLRRESAVYAYAVFNDRALLRPVLS